MVTELGLDSKRENFQQKLHPHYRMLLLNFKKSSRSLVGFNLLYAFLFSSCLTSLIYCYSHFFISTVIAFHIGGLFLISFSYFVLLFYLQTRKPEKLSTFVDQFLKDCREALPKENSMFLADASIKLSNYLHDFEKTIYSPPFKLKKMKKLSERFGFYCHFEDVCSLKKLLLSAAINEHIHQIRLEPTDLELHTSLANTYVLLSKVYADARQKLESPFLKFRFKKLIRSINVKFEEAAKRAIDEFTIINEYAPNDPWVHMQLANSYRNLALYDLEIQEYESILQINPKDARILFRLGILYFEQGSNAKGLKIYENLLSLNPKRAKELISFYGAYRTEMHTPLVNL